MTIKMEGIYDEFILSKAEAFRLMEKVIEVIAQPRVDKVMIQIDDEDMINIYGVKYERQLN